MLAPVRLLLAAALALPLAAIAGPAAPAAAGGTGTLGLPLTVTDAHNDWEVGEGAGSLTRAQKASIDLFRVRLTGVDSGAKVRFVFVLKKLTRSGDFDQIVQVRLRPRKGSAWSAAVDLSVQDPTDVAATYEEGSTLRYCSPRAHRDRSAGLVRVDVPVRCLPTAPARVRVLTATGHWGSDAFPYSTDTMKVPGLVSLR
ncbi:hypothetical protein [Nocardioides sp. GY 10127]|uniref:hypothetical protein n=1 Tax=Nocardioides sp. GY 10127 TaxID=2569762 RepID=UPI00197D97D6|nr:hypothetical protein [Nocardioides sp. GY 10127]